MAGELVHNHDLDPSCPEQLVAGKLQGQCVADNLDEWCRRVDDAVADGVDPMVAIVDADAAMREALQLSLDRD